MQNADQIEILLDVSETTAFLLQNSESLVI